MYVILGCSLTVSVRGLLKIWQLYRLQEDMKYLKAWMTVLPDMPRDFRDYGYQQVEKAIDAVELRREMSVLSVEAWKRIW